VLRLEQWAEIRRLYFVKRLSIKEVARRTGHGRNTNRPTLRSAEPPRYRQRGPSAAGTRIRERPCESGRAGSKMILDKLLCEVRPLLFCHATHLPAISYRLGALLQFDLSEPTGRSRSARGRRGAATSSSAASPLPRRPPAARLVLRLASFPR
jgi:hypothetical protein